MRLIDADALREQLQRRAYDDWNQGVVTSWADAYREVIDMIDDMPSVEPSAQPEVQPIGYRDCANAMMRMWMDNVITDGEYSRIMDKLNAFWEMSKDGN